MTWIEDEGDTEAKDKKNLETYNVKHQSPRPIQNMTYLKNYEATGLRKKKQT
jgi:hypothetical protein